MIRHQEGKFEGEMQTTGKKVINSGATYYACIDTRVSSM